MIGRTALAFLLAVGSLSAGCRLEQAQTELDDEGSTSGRCVVVATTEFGAAGSISIIDAESLAVASDLTATHQDALVRVADDRVFVVNRQGGDSVQELDPARRWATVWQYSVGNGSNPWDIAILADSTAWVPLYNTGSLVRVDTLSTSHEGFVVGEPTALPTWTDDDERVEPSAALLHDGVLYVTVQGLDDYPSCEAGSRGYMHAFDPDDLAPLGVFDGEATLELAACNPMDQRLLSPDLLAIGHAGRFRSVERDQSVDDGGLELVDLAAGASRGLVASEADLGDRDIVTFAIGERGRAWIALADADFSVSVFAARLDEAQLTLGEAVWTSETGGVFDLAERFGRVWIADRTPGTSGVVVLDAATGELVEVISTGFPPYDLDFIDLAGTCF